MAPSPSIRWPTSRKARLTPESEDRLITGTGPVNVELTGPDFQFVEKMELKKASDRRAVPVAILFDFDKGKRAGVQNRITAEAGHPQHAVHRLRALAMMQSDGKRQDLPVRVLPPVPKLTNGPLRVNLGEKQQAIVLRGSGLDRVTKLEAPNMTIELEPKGTAEERKATVHLGEQAQKGALVDVAMSVDGHNAPVPLKGSPAHRQPAPAH